MFKKNIITQYWIAFILVMSQSNYKLISLGINSYKCNKIILRNFKCSFSSDWFFLSPAAHFWDYLLNRKRLEAFLVCRCDRYRAKRFWKLQSQSGLNLHNSRTVKLKCKICFTLNIYDCQEFDCSDKKIRFCNLYIILQK